MLDVQFAVPTPRMLQEEPAAVSGLEEELVMLRLSELRKRAISDGVRIFRRRPLHSVHSVHSVHSSFVLLH